MREEVPRGQKAGTADGSKSRYPGPPSEATFAAPPITPNRKHSPELDKALKIVQPDRIWAGLRDLEEWIMPPPSDEDETKYRTYLIRYRQTIKAIQLRIEKDIQRLQNVESTKPASYHIDTDQAILILEDAIRNLGKFQPKKPMRNNSRRGPTPKRRPIWTDLDQQLRYHLDDDVIAGIILKSSSDWPMAPCPQLVEKYLTKSGTKLKALDAVKNLIRVNRVRRDVELP